MSELAAIRRHRSARIVGIPMFAIGALGIVAAIAAWVGADGGWRNLGLYIAATGFSLGTFGIHNDTALALMVRAGRSKLQGKVQAELDLETDRDANALNALVPHTIASWIVLVAALGLHTLAARALLQAWAG